MATNYPGSLDTSTQQPSPSASTEMDDSGFEHDVVHANHSGAIIAVETKVGTGASTPVANSVLGGTGSGTSAWTTTPAVSGLTVSGDAAFDTDTLFVDASQDRVGVNRSSPVFPLHAFGATVDSIVGVESGDAGAYIAFTDSNSTGNSYDRRIGVTGNDLKFQTGATDRMTIQADGQVGIGTTTPFAPLQLFNSTTDTVARFGSGDPGVYISFYDNTSANETNARIGAYGDKLVLLAGGSDRMVIKSDGKVGIGTTIPSTPLHISDDDHAILRLQNEGTGNTEGPTIELYGNTGRMGLLGFDNSDDIRIKNETSAGKLFFFTNNSVRATILPSGNVGIGTDSPANPLHVNGGTANFVARLESTDGEAYLGLQDGASSSAGHVAVGAIGDDLVFRAGNNNVARFDSNGFLGIGSTGPGRPLEIKHTHPAIRLKDISTSDHIFHDFLGDGDGLSIRADANGDATSPFINFQIGGSQKAVITNDGRLGIGTTSPAEELHILKNQDGVLTQTLVENLDQRLRLGAYYEAGVAQYSKIQSEADNGSDQPLLLNPEGGNVGIGTTSPAAKLDVAGDTTSTGHFTAQRGGADGGIVLGQTFSSSYVGLRTANMGEASANEYIIMSSGTHTFISAGSTGDVFIRGGGNDTSCQIFLDTSENNIAVTGTMSVSGTLTASGVIDVNEVLGDNGSATDPSFTFTTDSNTGLFRQAADVLGITTGGTERVRIGSFGIRGDDSGDVYNFDAFKGNNGSASSPTFSFDSDTNTGMYRSGADELAFTTGGSQRVKITSGGTLIWTGSSAIGGPLTDTTSTSGFRYVLQNQFFGTLQDFSSIRDRKEQITNVTTADSARWIDALQPVTYIERWLGEGEEPADNKKWREADMQVGFIADDVLASTDTSHFAQVTDNGEGGLDPSGWKWETVIAAAVAEIKSLRTRVAVLENA